MTHPKVDLVVEEDGTVEGVGEHDFVVGARDALNGGDGWVVEGPGGGVVITVELDSANFYA